MASPLFDRVPAGAVAAALLCPIAGANPPQFNVVWDASQDDAEAMQFNWNDYGEAPVFGDHVLPGSGDVWTGWLYEGEMTAAGGEWTLAWDVVFNEPGAATAGGEGLVTTHIVVTNNTVFTQNFQSEMVLPLGAPVLSPEMSGFTQGTVTDLTFDAATVSAPAGGQIYTPRIDGFDETAGYLLEDPFAESAGLLGTSAFGPETFGDPDPLAASRDALEQISIFLSFDLTAGDSASLTAAFQVSPVPAPSVLALLGPALLAARRRRR